LRNAHLAQPFEQRLGAELDLFHDRGVGPERDCRTGAIGVPDALQRAVGLATVAERLDEAAAVALDLEHEVARQRVHDRHADAVQTTGDLVALAAELAAGVQHREHDFGRGLVGIFGVRIGRNSPAVVDNAAPPSANNVTSMRVA